MRLPPAPAAALALAAVCAAPAPLPAQPPGDPAVTTGYLSALGLRGIGPALMSGRIADVAVDPTNRSVWYVATASSNVWKTENRGTTWTPIFDDHPSYSTGAIAIDPTDSNVIWLGTGENTSQRSVGWGDGVYKSLDGGRSWTNTGLATSEHIGRILIDPRDPDVVYAAAMGGLWAPGGERGLYRTTDGGESWAPVLEISENTGIADVHFDPRDPDVLYAVAFQRRRHVGILVAGGPESGVWKSTDGGESWRDITRGLPSGDLGRIALAVSPIDPDVVYALAAATEDRSGFYRSPDRGETWARMSDYIVVDPQYYGELYPDPHRMDRVYAVDVYIHVTEDGGRTFERVNTRFKHVDNHSINFDPHDPDYMLVGTDGGLYETFDRTRTWRYVPNLPLTQFYRVGIDNMSPFYTVYGGTQDNSSVGGPSRTDNVHGIRSSDWFITHGGDGFQARIDPDDPNIVYTQSQYAGIVRYDRASGEELDIQPQPEAGEGALRWHWDSPLIISPHDSRRIYFAAQKLFRSDDRAETWTAVSGDLSRGLDRNQRRVMGRTWPPEAVWKNVFTSPYGTIVALDESPLVEGLLYVGTDDGLVQVSEDGGGGWRREEAFAGVPAMAYVADVVASRHDPDRVYAVFNNHKEGDFRPYVTRSDDRGASWTDITGDVPDGQSSWTLVEDHVDPDLLFLGTEFGLFATLDGGGSWVRLRGGLPTIAVRDLEIQRRENDLVLATFGRGFYILDDYSPLRTVDEAVAAGAAHLFPVKDPWAYIPGAAAGRPGEGDAGRRLLHRPEPSLRRRLHLPPAARPRVPQGAAAAAGAGGPRAGRRHRLPRPGHPDRRGHGAAPRGVRGGVRRRGRGCPARPRPPRGRPAPHRVGPALRVAGAPVARRRRGRRPHGGARRVLGARRPGRRRRPRGPHGRAVLHGPPPRLGHPRRLRPRRPARLPARGGRPAARGHRHRPGGARDLGAAGAPAQRGARRPRPGRGPVRGAASAASRTASSRSGGSCRGTAPRSTAPSSRRPRSCSASRASWARSSGPPPRLPPPSATATPSRRRSWPRCRRRCAPSSRRTSPHWRRSWKPRGCPGRRGGRSRGGPDDVSSTAGRTGDATRPVRTRRPPTGPCGLRPRCDRLRLGAAARPHPPRRFGRSSRRHRRHPPLVPRRRLDRV